MPADDTSPEAHAQVPDVAERNPDRAADGMYTLSTWSRPGPAVAVLDMSEEDAWDILARRYAPDGEDPPLQRIFEIARTHCVTSIVIETRYIDADWRNQLARFFGGTFRRYPSVCHRLHFFSAPLAVDLSNLDQVDNDNYRGYTVLRPFPIAPVGKTMIQAPTELDDAAVCEATDHVDLIGRRFSITSMPFISQDTQFLRCAHASMWMVLTHAALTQGIPRPLPGDIHDAAIGGEKVGRQLPNGGLSGSQLWSALESLGLSPQRRSLSPTREDEEPGPVRLYTIMRRYVHSSLPPLITSNSHAWVVVAYTREPSGGDPNLTLWRHDDSRGPYIKVDDPWDEEEDGHRPWGLAYLPLPRKAYVDAERVSTVARDWLRGFAENKVYDVPAFTAARERENPQHRWTLRTYLIRSSIYKQGIADRDLSPELAEAYRRAPMSRYVWVVEIIDCLNRERGLPDVMGEFILDATITQHEPVDDPAGMLAVHIDDIAFIPGVDGAKPLIFSLESGRFYATSCPAMNRRRPNLQVQSDR